MGGWLGTATNQFSEYVPMDLIKRRLRITLYPRDYSCSEVDGRSDRCEDGSDKVWTAARRGDACNLSHLAQERSLIDKLEAGRHAGFRHRCHDAPEGEEAKDQEDSNINSTSWQ